MCKVRGRTNQKDDKSSKKRKRDQEEYTRYYATRRKKFGWGLDSTKLTKEQMSERGKLKSRSFKRNQCPSCKIRFRMRYRLNEHMKKKNCSCEECGYIYMSAFERSAHKLSCRGNESKPLKSEYRERKTSFSQLSVPTSMEPREHLLYSPFRELVNYPGSILYGHVPNNFFTTSKITIPSLSLEFSPKRIRRPASPVKNLENERVERTEPPLVGIYEMNMKHPHAIDKENISLDINGWLID